MLERVWVSGLTQDEQDAFDANLAQLRGRHPRNFVRSCLYDGKSALDGQRSSVIPPQYYNLGIALGWPAKAIDALVRRCQLDGLSWAEGDLDSLGAAELIRENGLMSELRQGLTDSALHGPSYIITTQGLPGEPRSLVHVKDALSATGILSPRTRRLDSGLSVTGWEPNRGLTPASFVLYLPNLTVSAEKVDGKWQVERSEHIWGVPMEPLIYKPRPSKRLGQSRLTRPMISLHRQAVTELVRLEGHMDIYSYPEMWLLGGDMSAFKNADGSQKAVWQVMLGRIKGLQDDDSKPDALARADVKQFPAASPTPHLDALDALSRAFAREACIPDSAVALRGVSNPTSADAYDASQYELIAEAEGAMSDWAAPISRAIARALAIQNGTAIDPRWLSIRPEWLGAKFESRAAKADAGAKQLGAVPWLAETQVGLELLGLTDQQIQRALAERRRSSGRAVLAALGSRDGLAG